MSNRKDKKYYIAFANGIPRFRSGRGIKRILTKQLKPFHCCKISVDHNSDGHARGFAWLYFKSVEHRDHCCEEMHNRLYIEVADLSAPFALNESDATCDVKLKCRLFLTLRPCNDIKRCHAFPQVSSKQQTCLRLDHEALFSITDNYTAIDMAGAIECFLVVYKTIYTETTSNSPRSENSIAIDCTAGGGGNAIALIESGLFNEVRAIEQIPSRCQDLKHNIEVVLGSSNVASNQCKWSVLCGDACGYLLGYSPCCSVPVGTDLTTSRPQHANEEIDTIDDCRMNKTMIVEVDELFDLLFFDPPWGGLDYFQSMNILSSTPILPSDYILYRSGSGATHRDEELALNATNCSLDSAIANNNAGTSIAHLLGHEFTFGTLAKRVKIAAVKVPSDFDAAAFFSIITAPGAWAKEEEIPSRHLRRPPKPAIDCRPHPFRLQFGARTALLVVAYPPYFNNKDLTMLMRNLAEFDKTHGNELHPRFFDWETKTWISCRRWHGT